jgi:Ran GTPase-activating protein (RanGAP) involved in mRNA processing and transport
MAIARYIKKADKTLASLELERNEIGDVGGEALLNAMQSNMRMEKCQMAFGNPMRQKISRQIEREIKANIQIKASVVPAYQANNNRLSHYEESDRGPDFVRCALKSCELFKILHLSLPDNMIGEKEMNDIAYVLQKNTPLRHLNLSKNVIDAKASLVLANALRQNSNLRELDLSDNRMKDAGLALLMEIFVLQQLQREFKRAEKAQMKNLALEPKKPANESLDEDERDQSKDHDDKKLIQKKEKKPRYKMKIEKLLLERN